MGVASRVHDVVEAMLAVADATLSDWQILDGPRAAQELADNVLIVGVGNEEDADPYRTVRDDYDLGNRPREVITVRCSASTWHGDLELAPLRVRLVDLLTTLEAAYRSDPRLSDTCALVRLGNMRWYHLQVEDGSAVGVLFDVHVVTYL